MTDRSELLEEQSDRVCTVAIPAASFGHITLWKIHISQILG